MIKYIKISVVANLLYFDQKDLPFSSISQISQNNLSKSMITSALMKLT
ncbi:hypothetical protein ACVWYN_001345 [Pedobacter sp. UYP24]